MVIEITVLSENYINGIDICSIIDDLFEDENIRLKKGVEQYVEGAFIQTLTFTKSIKK